MAPILHVVLLRVRPSLPASEVTAACEAFKSLQHTCLRLGKPYITRMVGGVDNSLEGMTHGMTHAFVVEFASKDDRDYYVNEDPAHAEFKTRVWEYLEQPKAGEEAGGMISGIVLDFEDSVYNKE